MACCIFIYLSVFHFAVLTLSLVVPLVVAEDVVDFPIRIEADRDVATSLSVLVFSVANTTAGLAQGKVKFEPF